MTDGIWLCKHSQILELAEPDYHHHTYTGSNAHRAAEETDKGRSGLYIETVSNPRCLTLKENLSLNRENSYIINQNINYV